MARIAEVWRLNAFDDLSLIGRYAEKFGRDPDDVFYHSRASTVLGYAVMWKEMDEYQDRFYHLYQELTKPDQKK